MAQTTDLEEDMDMEIIFDSGITSPTIGEASYVEHRNNYRLPASHRFECGVNFNKKTKHGMRTWNISLYNAYNAMNLPSYIAAPAKRSYKTDYQEVYYTSINSITSLTLINLNPL